MNRSPFIVLLSFLAGCSAPRNAQISTEELVASQHMLQADSLMTASALRKATGEYVWVAKEYSATKYAPEATLHAALLYAVPQNPAANDSLALHWFRQYLTLQVPAADKENARACIALLESIRKLRQDVEKLRRELDKLREVDVKMNKKGGSK